MRIVDADILKKYQVIMQYEGKPVRAVSMITINNCPTLEINTNEIEYKAYCKGLEDGKKIARPKGKWEKHSTYDGVLICTNCNHGSNKYSAEFRYCPYCGAQMEVNT